MTLSTLCVTLPLHVRVLYLLLSLMTAPVLSSLLLPEALFHLVLSVSTVG